MRLIPLQPSQIDPHPTESDGDTHLNPVFAEQNFFPTFFRAGQFPPARPFSNRQIPGSSSPLRYSNVKPSGYDESILGSGDFSVLSGGTFYPEGEGRPRPSHDYFGSGSSFHETSNSGRPFALPLEASHYSDDPFAHFKDFADITAGIDSDFSHINVVYANKNSTSVRHEPKNILEQLQMIDEEKRNEELANQRAEALPSKPTKLSKFKSKLLITKLTRVPSKFAYPKKESPSDLIDPLVAES